MNYSLILDPVLPQWVLIVLTILAVMVGVFYIFRAPRSGIFRFGALGVLLILLANPQLQTDERTPLNDIVLVLLDQSQSQILDNRDEITDRVLERLNVQLSQMDDLEIRTVTVAGDQETRIVDALRQAIPDIPRDQLSAVFMVTDGQASTIILDAEGDPASLPNVKNILPENVPLHVLLTGRDTEKDRIITLNSAPRYGIVRESVRVSFRIDDVGPDHSILSDGVNVPVSLRVDGQVILSQDVPTGQNVGFDVPLNRPGKLIIELIVGALEDELTVANNNVVLPITAVRDRLRVLLISGEPNPGERVWRNLLKSDPSIDMVHFTILRTQDKFDAALQNELALIPFPYNELFIEKLKEFDLVIFDRYTWRNVLKSYHFDNIARYVEEGGAMLVASGPEYNGRLSLARRRTISYLLPVLPMTGTVEKAFRPVVSELGKRHPVTANLPDQEFWGRWLRAIPTRLRNGTALMTGPDDTPILILDRVGQGRIGMIQSDHIWLWARGFDGGGPHAELLRRTAHWLMKEPQLEEESLSLIGREDELLITRRSLLDELENVVLTLPDGTKQNVELLETAPGEFQATIGPLPVGLYRASAGDLFAIGAIGLATAPELQDVVSQSRKLGPIAVQTGGGVFKARRGADEVRLPTIRRTKVINSTPANGQERLTPRNGNNNGTSRINRVFLGRYTGPGWAGIIPKNTSQLDGRRLVPFGSPLIWLLLAALMIGLAWFVESRSGESADNSLAAT